MSAYLDAVEQTRDTRADARADYAQADKAFRVALRQAAQHHSLRVIARHAGIGHTGVKKLLDAGGGNDE